MDSGDNNTHVLPVFFKNDSVLPNRNEQNFMRPYEVCNAAAQVVGSDNIDGAQQIKNLWRLYVKSDDARMKLLTESLSLRNKHVQLLDRNPYSPRQTDDNLPVVRVTVADIPLSFDNQCIAEHLQTEYNLELLSDINYQYKCLHLLARLRRIIKSN